ncbi:MAG: hypothetical protein GY807_20975 [Gammaproteobacteria bacterium]|nr:hypothetical protein [Gammaproteobacteria bacterium]
MSEREKFMHHLNGEINSHRSLLGEINSHRSLLGEINSHRSLLDAMNRMSWPIEIEKKYKNELLAMRVVLDMLSSVEIQTIK